MIAKLRRIRGGETFVGIARGRELSLLHRIKALSLASSSVLVIAAFVSVLHGSKDNNWVSAASMGLRDPASRPFPTAASTNDVGDTLEDYKPYLNFVLAVGKDVDPTAAKGLATRFTTLRKNDPKAAARFLRTLKFEMDQRLALAGGSTQRLNSDSPIVRAWVKRFIRNWNREANEGLFRVYALRLAARNQQIKEAAAE